MERHREAIEACDEYCDHLYISRRWCARITIFNHEIVFETHKKRSNGEFSYHLKAYFKLPILLKQAKYRDQIGVYLFKEKKFSSFDELLVEYNNWTQKVKSKESFENVKRESLFSFHSGDVFNNILSECHLCTEDYGSEYCKDCGYCMCMFCLCAIEKTFKIKCPQCRTVYHYAFEDESEYSSDEGEN